MALVTLGASLALPRDGARLPVVVNLAAALLLGMALERLPGARGFVRLTPSTAQATSITCGALERERTIKLCGQQQCGHNGRKNQHTQSRHTRILSFFSPQAE